VAVGPPEESFWCHACCCCCAAKACAVSVFPKQLRLALLAGESGQCLGLAESLAKMSGRICWPIRGPGAPLGLAAIFITAMLLATVGGLRRWCGGRSSSGAGKWGGVGLGQHVGHERSQVGKERSNSVPVYRHVSRVKRSQLGSTMGNPCTVSRNIISKYR
jgi:hypothetical protein